MIQKIKENWLIILIFVLLLAERLFITFYMGVGSYGSADDQAYVDGGIYFAQTGIITAWNLAPSATVMPGTTFIAGVISIIFGEGTVYVAACKFVWILMGLFTSFFSYKTVRLFMPKWCGIITLCVYLLPNLAWMDTFIETETPYLLCFSIALYYTFKLNDELSIKNSLFYAISITLGLTIRANMIIFPFFTLIYLWFFNKKKISELLPLMFISCFVLSLFLVPWAIRNHSIYDRYLITPGAGNPNLRGTYQGTGAPNDYEIDLSEMTAEFFGKYSEYYNEEGLPKNDAVAEYLMLQYQEMQAECRIRYWLTNNPLSFFKAYFIEKPFNMLNWVWYWGPFENILSPFLRWISRINLLLCLIALILSFIQKRFKAEICFLELFYFVSLYIIAMSYAIERYAAMLMPLRYLISIFGLYLISHQQLKGKPLIYTYYS